MLVDNTNLGPSLFSWAKSNLIMGIDFYYTAEFSLVEFYLGFLHQFRNESGVGGFFFLSDFVVLVILMS